MSEERDRELGAVLRLGDGVIITRFRDDPLLAEEEDNGIMMDTDTGRFMFINGPALDFLEAFWETGSREGAMCRLIEIYDVDKATLEEDVQGFQQQLADLGLLSE